VTSLAERLASGTAYIDASSLRVTGIAGSDARAWLNELVSADVGVLGPGRSVPSLLLAPTGGVRAAFTLVLDGDGFLALQDASQERSVAELLAPYVLSSDVSLRDRTGDLAILAFPGLAQPPAIDGARPSSPSALGRGADLIASASEHDRIATELATRGFARAGGADAESWRIAAGIPRVGVDTADGDLPQEAALEGAVAFAKGCFVGQEAVAKTRDRGHPRRALLAFEADAEVAAGEAVTADGGVVGAVTSAVSDGRRTRGLARVRWAARESDLRTEAGVELSRR